MPLRPEVGDTVVMRVRVTKVNSNSFYFARDRTIGGIPVVWRCPYLMHVDLIDEIIPKPWVPKAGDRISYRGGIGPIYTLVWIKNSEIGYVVWDKNCTSPASISLKECTLCAD